MKLKGLRKRGKKTLTNQDYWGGYLIPNSVSLGDGLWVLEVYDYENNFITSFSGSNGQLYGEEPADLWKEFDEWRNQIHHSYIEYEAPDGDIGPYSYFMKEAYRGRLHGCLLRL